MACRSRKSTSASSDVRAGSQTSRKVGTGSRLSSSRWRTDIWERIAGRKGIKGYLADTSLNTKGLKREDIFFTPKLASNSDYRTARASIKQSVKTCGLGCIDLYLLHSPYGGKTARLPSWKAVEDAIKDGVVRIGGVSSSGVKHLEELIASKSRIMPAMTQIQVHPFNTRTSITDFCTKNGILVEAYALLARALKMKHPTIAQLLKKYQCTPAQLMVRWSCQHGFIPLPKGVSKQRIEANGKDRRI